jgi:hypothetical protein
VYKVTLVMGFSESYRKNNEEKNSEGIAKEIITGSHKDMI